MQHRASLIEIKGIGHVTKESHPWERRQQASQHAVRVNRAGAVVGRGPEASATKL
jgi:hypothetical protein